MFDCKISYFVFCCHCVAATLSFTNLFVIYSVFTQPNALLNCCSLLQKCKWQNKTLAAADRLISNGKKESEMQTNIISCQCCCKHFSKILFIRASNRIFAYMFCCILLNFHDSIQQISVIYRQSKGRISQRSHIFWDFCLIILNNSFDSIQIKRVNKKL